MNKPREDRGMLSRLPDDPGYWDGLTDRIVADAGADLGVRREDRGQWWSAMASFSSILATGAVAAVVALVSLLPAQVTRSDPGTEVRVVDLFGIAPRDRFATPLLMAESPPSIDVLVWNTTENQP